MSLRRDERGRSEQPGISSRHVLSAGPFYDPDLISFGPVIGVDEHLVAPGAGFDWHAHRGVHIVSWVLEGTLRHEDTHGEVRLVSPGTALVQSTGDGIRHTETNASDSDPLRFLQITVLGEATPSVSTTSLPAVVAGVGVDVRRVAPVRGPALLLALRDGYSIESTDPLLAGAWLELDSDDQLSIDADPEALGLVLEWR